jgi:hypothetical protein
LETDMTTFTVHEPLPRKREDVAPPERFAFVRDGFYFWAFVLGPVWMLYHRLWLVFVMYAVGMTALQVALWTLGVSALAKFTVAILIALLVGFEAGSLRRWSLRRWINRGIVVAYNREAAEHRFFDRWSTPSPTSDARMSPPPPPTPPSHVPTSDQDIIGLFPQPQPRP